MVIVKARTVVGRRRGKEGCYAVLLFDPESELRRGGERKERRRTKLLLLVLQSRLGDKWLGISVLCPQIGTAVVKRKIRRKKSDSLFINNTSDY